MAMDKYKTMTSFADFAPRGELGEMLTKARKTNQLNDQLSQFLPEVFKTLSLCTIQDGVATFAAPNQVIAFRAQKQVAQLLTVLHKIPELASVQQIKIHVNLA